MTLRVPHVIKKVAPDESDMLNDNFGRAYSHKLESRLKFEGSSSQVISVLYQSAEHGQFSVSANGSHTITRTVSLGSQKGTIVYADAHAISPLLSAHVTDITATAITIVVRAVQVSGTAVVISDVTTATVQVFYQLIAGDT